MVPKRIVVSIYLKNDRVIRLYLGKLLFISIFVVCLSIVVWPRYGQDITLMMKDGINSVRDKVKTSRKIAAVEKIESKKTIEMPATKEEKPIARTSSWTDTGLAVKEIIRVKNNLRFFLTKDPSAATVINEGEIKVKLVSKDNTFTIEKESEPYSFNHGRFTLVDLQSYDFEMIKNIVIQIKDLSGKIYNTTISL